MAKHPCQIAIGNFDDPLHFHQADPCLNIIHASVQILTQPSQHDFEPCDWMESFVRDTGVDQFFQSDESTPGGPLLKPNIPRQVVHLGY